MHDRSFFPLLYNNLGRRTTAYWGAGILILSLSAMCLCAGLMATEGAAAHHTLPYVCVYLPFAIRHFLH